MMTSRNKGDATEVSRSSILTWVSGSTCFDWKEIRRMELLRGNFSVETILSLVLGNYGFKFLLEC